MKNTKTPLISKRIPFVVALIITMFMMLSVFSASTTKAEEVKVSIIKIHKGTAVVPGDGSVYNKDYRYSFRAVKDGETATDINGLYGNLNFKDGISDPVFTSLAINETYDTTYLPYIWAIGLPENVTLECYKPYVREKNSGDLYTLEEADITASAEPYPEIEVEKTCSRVISVLYQDSYWVLTYFRLVDKDGNTATDVSGTFGGIPFKNGEPITSDTCSRTGSFYDYYYGGKAVCYYLFGNDDTLVIDNLPEGVYIKVMDQMAGGPCMPTSPDPKVIEYKSPPAPKAEYDVEYYLEQLDGTYKLEETVTFEDDIGSTVTVTPVEYENYTFNKEASTISGGLSAEYRLVMKLYYNRNHYTLKYDRNEATDGNMSDKTEKYEQTFHLDKNQFTKDGYDFKGWNTEKDGDGKAYSDGAEFTIIENTVLFAQWELTPKPEPDPEPETHKLTYKLDGGTYKGSSEDIVEEHKKGDKIKIHEAPDEREGYIFQYWKGSEYYPGDDYTVEKDHEFTAVWKKVEPESSVPESSDPESSVPESSDPESSVPESSDPESSIPESSDPAESSTPEEKDPENKPAKTGESEKFLTFLFIMLVFTMLSYFIFKVMQKN